MPKPELTIILPGLARILEQQINNNVIPDFLSKIINKARFQPDSTGLTRLLFNHFSQTPLTGSDLPINNLSDKNSTVLRADPCYLHADRDRLLLFADDLALTAQESAELIAEIQPLFAEFGGELVAEQPESWLLNLATMPDLTFSALPEVTGKGVDKYLPTGADQQNWIRLWNEIQMKLYDTDINQQRIADGKLPINSVWFWGVGAFVAKKDIWQQVQGRLLVLKQLAEQSDTTWQSDTDWSITSLSSGKHLWVLDEIDLEADWQQQLQQLDGNILQALWQQLAKAKIATIELQIPNHGHYQLSPIDCWKCWK